MSTKILFIDDDPITLMLCKKVVEKAQFSVDIDYAKNGEEALTYFDNLFSDINNNENCEIKYPELLFLDLNMPIMDGWAFLEEFSQKKHYKAFKDVKVIVLSSTIDPKDISKSKEYPIVIDFLSKPITLDMISNLRKKLNK